ncbi:MAG: DUF899 family protein [Fimbriimonadaceae bacterium]|nr:DUF899 family protein [Fimbriimonadaceae bacterium]QYK59546.1 MAG: DUF899 family protein [Fimbriimonadaceae bacterium]
MSNDLAKSIYELKQQLSEALASAEPEPFEDFSFDSEHGPVRLSELFGDHEEMLLIHNMGESCSYCTLWADGLSGFVPHLRDRAAFVLVSPDDLETQKRIKNERGWKHRMVRDASREFSRRAGTYTDEHGWWPGVSGFRKTPEGIVRTGRADFGPGDDFCGVWPMLDLIGGPKGWEPTNAV